MKTYLILEDIELVHKYLNCVLSESRKSLYSLVKKERVIARIYIRSSRLLSDMSITQKKQKITNVTGYSYSINIASPIEKHVQGTYRRIPSSTVHPN